MMTTDDDDDDVNKKKREGRGTKRGQERVTVRICSCVRSFGRLPPVQHRGYL